MIAEGRALFRPPRPHEHLCHRMRWLLGRLVGVLACAPPELLVLTRQADVWGLYNQETPKQIVRGNHLQMCHQEKSRTIANKSVKVTFPLIF